MQTDNEDQKHIAYITRKANAALGWIWSMGERFFKEKWKKRMRIFDAMISSILRYGAEIWGWSTWKEIERCNTTHVVRRLDPGT